MLFYWCIWLVGLLCSGYTSMMAVLCSRPGIFDFSPILPAKRAPGAIKNPIRRKRYKAQNSYKKKEGQTE